VLKTDKRRPNIGASIGHPTARFKKRLISRIESVAMERRRLVFGGDAAVGGEELMRTAPILI
jgi:hypothetical protein